MPNNRPDPAALQRQCTDFNNRFMLGSACTVRLDSGDVVLTKTRSFAEVMGGHSAVIWLEGISGCYALDRVTGIDRQFA